MSYPPLEVGWEYAGYAAVDLLEKKKPGTGLGDRVPGKQQGNWL